MADQALVFAALADFAHRLAGRYAIADVLHELTDRLAAALELAGAGASVGEEQGALRFVTASTDALTAVEKIQEATNRGRAQTASSTVTS
jgi:hypothetical protein